MARILITSALPYINGVKHLGNLAGSMLPADIYARAMRLLGHEVLYICATDEHGTPAELAAQAAERSVADYCEEMHEAQASAGAEFKLSYDYFGRSSAPSNHALTQHFAHKLEERGLIEERTSRQVYSNADGRFLPDRYVEGTCPNCDYEKARGDQCDSCGKLLDPVDLIEPYSAVSGSKDVEVRETNHLYLKQSVLSDDLREWVNASEGWPPLATSIALKWLDEGLRDRAITRDLSWGIPVTNLDGSIREGFEGKVFYVWFDAPIEYIAATQDWANENYEAREFRKAMAETRAIWAAGNEYLTKAAPWTHYKTDIDQAAIGTRVGLNLVALFGILAQPVIPDTADKILKAIGVPEGNRSWRFGDADDIAKLIDALPNGLPVQAPDMLFSKIEDDDIAAWSERFGGDGA